MADRNTTPEPVYQTPEWETRTRPARRSLLGRFALPGADASTDAGTNQNGHAIASKEAAAPIPAAVPTTDPAHTNQSPVRRRLDAILPPHRTYMGRSRRSLLLYIILPLAILLFIILPLAVGLGVGLSRRGSSNSTSQSLPLPTNTATFNGELTYYEPGLGACGVTSGSGDNIVSVSHIIFDAAGVQAGSGSNPNANPLCGRKIRIQRDFVEKSDGGGGGNRSVDVVVVDRCTGCLETDLDVSLGVFTQLALEESGRVGASWAWLG